MTSVQSNILYQLNAAENIVILSLSLPNNNSVSEIYAGAAIK